MISRTTTLTDDHGDQFARMHAAYVQKVNSAEQADRDGLAHELAERTFVDEFRSPAAHAPGRDAIRGRLGRFARVLDRFDSVDR